MPGLRIGKVTRRARTPLLIHYHIFKNAGTSFEWALQQALGETFQSFDTSSPRGFVTARAIRQLIAQNPDLRAIATHQAAPPPPKIRGRQVYSSILIRDPIARIRSIYEFEKRQSNPTPGSVRAKELNFRDYIRWRLDETPTAICDFQVRFCVRSRLRFPDLVTAKDLQKAIRNLRTIDLVGTLARYEEWLHLARRVLAQPFPAMNLVSVQLNRTRASVADRKCERELLAEELGEETARYLIENNQLDEQLHFAADALLSQRVVQQHLAS